MSKFFVGCPVRIVAAHPSMSQFVGVETRIVGRATPDYPRSEWLLDVEQRGERVGARSEHLSPILPDGHRASDHSFTELMDRCRAGEVECV